MKKRVLRILGATLTVILLTVFVTSAGGAYEPPVLVSAQLEMYYYDAGTLKCGPESGLSIGRYYRDVKEYSGLKDDTAMFNLLWDHMDPNHTGYTGDDAYGSGFEAMTEHSGYLSSVFDHQDDSIVTYDDFWNIVDAINQGHPVALHGKNGFPKPISNPLAWYDGRLPTSNGHWVAIKGYSYLIEFPGGNPEYSDFRILCTDSLTCGNNAEFNWTEIIGLYGFSSIVIKDQHGVQGLVGNAATGYPLPYSMVTVKQSGQVLLVNETGYDGRYNISLPFGTYSVTASHIGFYDKTCTVVVSSNGFTTQNFQLTPESPGPIPI